MNNTTYRINHAGIDVIFKVEDIKDNYLRKVAFEAIKDFYQNYSPALNTVETAITYRFTDHINDFFIMDDSTVMSEYAKKNGTQMFMSGHGNCFGYEFKDGHLTTIYYNLKSPGPISNNTNKAKTRNFISSVEQQIALFYSRGYLHGLQLINLNKGISFLHACSFAINQNGYLVAATPGAGKSSLLLSLCFEKDINASFIADDFSCVDKKGAAHFVGRPMAIKSHQIQYFPQLQSVLNDMPFMQKLQWFLIKKRGLSYQGLPKKLFGDRIASNMPLKKAIYLTNHNKPTFEHMPISSDEFADLNANMLFSELFLGIEIMNHALILPGKHLLPTVDQFIKSTRDVISKIFKDIPCELVTVPFRSDPRELLKFLKDEKIIEPKD